MYRNVQITQELYKLIEEFISISDPSRLQKYLFNYNIYSNYYSDKSITRNKLFDKYKENFAGTYRFYDLLNKFYTEVIEQKYGYKTISIDEGKNKIEGEFYIERIRPGDTRHFAICNLYLQGYNPLTIARLAGHDNLYTQINYAKHFSTFAESQVKVLTDRINQAKEFGDKMQDNSSIKELYKKSLFYNYKENKCNREIEEGYCIDEQFPNNCLTISCPECNFFRFKLNREKDISKMLGKSMKYNEEIKKQINIIRKVIKSTVLNKNHTIKNRCFNISEQNNIGVASKKLQQSIVQKAIVDSYIFELRKVENYE